MKEKRRGGRGRRKDLVIGVFKIVRGVMKSARANK